MKRRASLYFNLSSLNQYFNFAPFLSIHFIADDIPHTALALANFYFLQTRQTWHVSSEAVDHSLTW